MAKKSSKSKTPPVYVDIVSDVICPWCWLGARYFHKAAAQYKGKIELSWRPYMLDPSVPPDGVPYQDYMEKKFGKSGPGSRWTAMRQQLETSSPDVGITFNFSTIPKRPNTLNAHRLIRWAQDQGAAKAMSEALFKAVFTDGLDICDKDVLATLAGEAGLDSALVSERLATDKDVSAVQNEIFHFRNLGVSGVPTFIYNGQFAVQGAQPVNTHLDALAEAAKHPVDV